VTYYYDCLIGTRFIEKVYIEVSLINKGILCIIYTILEKVNSILHRSWDKPWFFNVDLS